MGYRRMVLSTSVENVSGLAGRYTRSVVPRGIGATGRWPVPYRPNRGLVVGDGTQAVTHTCVLTTRQSRHAAAVQTPHRCVTVATGMQPPSVRPPELFLALGLCVCATATYFICPFITVQPIFTRLCDDVSNAVIYLQ